jgi:xanthine dehydrogenase accessory factor
MFDLTALKETVAQHGKVARIVIAAFEGSSPRETGAAMLVWADGQSGTIGGGALEWQATLDARTTLAEDRSTRLDRVPLGPSLGQCCGGAVTLLTEVYDAHAIATLSADVIARSTDGREMPLAVKRLLSQMRGMGKMPKPQLLQGWFIEPVSRPQRQLWVWGAGHVGRALVGVLSPLPDLAITWVDVALDRFPETIPANVRALPVPNPADAVTLAPHHAEHLILTYSHALDLDLCHRLLTHGFAHAGLIGSATKWARFRSRLGSLGHTPAQIARIQCPIGDPSLGKHPQQIAIGVATTFLRQTHHAITQKETAL